MDQSHGAKPFQFDRIFSAPSPGDALRFGEDALSAAALHAELLSQRAAYAEQLAQARVEGIEQGYARASAERDEALLAAIDALHAAWDEFAATRDAMIAQLGGEARDLALAIGETLAGHALASAPGEAIDAAIGRALHQVARGQEIIISVAPDLIPDIEARIAHRQSNDRRHLPLIVEGDATLSPGDAHLRWDGGGMRLDAAARAEAVRAEMEAALQIIPTPLP
jgi:flagellar assembly protein FliH